MSRDIHDGLKRWPCAAARLAALSGYSVKIRPFCVPFFGTPPPAWRDARPTQHYIAYVLVMHPLTRLC